MTRLVSLASILIVVLLLSGAVYAKMGQGKGKMGCGDGMMGCSCPLMNISDLTAEQKTKMKEMCMKFMETMHASMKDMMDLQFKMKQERMKDSPDYTKIADLMKQMDELGKKMKEARIAQFKEVFNTVLTEDQKTKNKDMLDKGMGCCMGQGKMGMGKGGCGDMGKGKGSCGDKGKCGDNCKDKDKGKDKDKDK
jgi:hypothetical protein